MKLGIKVSFTPRSFDDLAATNPQMAEVWFDINRRDLYNHLFVELKRRRIDVGLHFWGNLPDKTWANIAYPDEVLNGASMDLMRQTIDIAAENGFAYVNIHPGSTAKASIDLIGESIKRISDFCDPDAAQANFLEHARILNDYAVARKVVFTVETVPARLIAENWYGPASRLNEPANIGELPSSALIEAANRGLWIANDFCHTAANIMNGTPQEIWQHVSAVTDKLFTRTRLIHLGFLVPPYNGTDIHDHLDNPIFETDQAIPNKGQMLELLKRFRNRDDVWILVEPKNDHVKNYLLAKKLLDESLQN